MRTHEQEWECQGFCDWRIPSHLAWHSRCFASNSEWTLPRGPSNIIVSLLGPLGSPDCLTLLHLPLKILFYQSDPGGHFMPSNLCQYPLFSQHLERSSLISTQLPSPLWMHWLSSSCAWDICQDIWAKALSQQWWRYESVCSLSLSLSNWYKSSCDIKLIFWGGGTVLGVEPKASQILVRRFDVKLHAAPQPLINFFFLLNLRQFSLWLRTHYVDQNGLELTDILLLSLRYWK